MVIQCQIETKNQPISIVKLQAFNKATGFVYKAIGIISMSIMTKNLF